MDQINNEAVFNLMVIVDDIKENINIEENLADLTGGIIKMDEQIESAQGLPNSEAVINTCIFVKCILLDLKVRILERNYSNLDEVEKQIKSLLRN
jgi:hypothetical protein